MPLNLTDAIQRQYESMGGKPPTGNAPRPDMPPNLAARQKLFFEALQKTPLTLPFAKPGASAPAPVSPFAGVSAEPQPQADLPKPPTSVATPISDATARTQKTFPNMDSRLAGLAGAGVATVEQMGKALGGAWAKTTGKEGGAVPFDTAMGGIPMIGLGVKSLEALAPQTKSALSTPLRDIPGVGAVVRGAEALGGAVNSGAEVVATPARTAVAMMRESNTAREKAYKSPVLDAARDLREKTLSWFTTGVSNNPKIFEDAGTTRQEAENLLKGLFTGQNTFEQNKKLEQVLRTASEGEAEKNPVSATVMTAVFDPLTYLDAGNIIPVLSNIQEVRRMWQAGGDIADAKNLTGATNPLTELIAKWFQPANVTDGRILSKEAAKIVQPQDNNALRRMVNAFRKTPTAQTVDNVQRAMDSLTPYLNDFSRPLADKVNLLKQIQAAVPGGKITPELAATMKQWGLANSEDFHKVFYALGKYDAAPVLARYERALQIADSLEQTTRSTTPGFSAPVAEFAKSEAQNLGGGYKDAFDFIIDGWEKGKLDITQMKEGIEKVAGLQLTADVTGWMGQTLADIAKIPPPNIITRAVNVMKRYEGLLFVRGNPASMVNNVLNDLSTTIRKGGTIRTEAQADEFLARHGLVYDDNIGRQVRKAAKAPEEIGGAYGSTAPSWVNKIPGWKQMGELFDKSQLVGRKAAHVSGVERAMNDFVPPPLPPKFKAWLGKDAVKIEAQLAKARNAREAADIVFGKYKTWTHYTDEVADELRTLYSEIAGRDVPITAQDAKGALPLHVEQNMNKVLRQANDLIAKGVAPADAWEIARKDVYGNDIFGDAAASVPTGPKPSAPPSGGGAAVQSVESFWNKLPASELNRMSEADRNFQIRTGRPATVSELEAMLAGKNPAPEVPLTQASPAQAPQAKPVEGVTSGNIVDTPSPAVADTAPVAGEQPVAAPAGVVETPKPNIIAQVKQRAAQLTQPSVDAGLVRQMKNLADSDPVRLKKMPAINPNAPLESARELIAVSRASGQKWTEAMADLFQQTAQYRHWQIEQGMFDSVEAEAKMQRMANGDALIKMLTENQRGLKFDELNQPSIVKNLDTWYRDWYAARGIEFPRPVKRQAGSIGQRADELSAKYQPRSGTSVAAGTGESVGSAAGTSAPVGESGVVGDVAAGASAEVGATNRAGDVGTGKTFKTAKGSTYTVETNGTTTRNKAARPEHPGDAGIKPTSEKTYYITPENALKLSEAQARGIKASIQEVGDGTIGLRYTGGKSAGKFERRTVIPFETEPRVGLQPLETWENGAKHHFGNKITEVGDVAAAPTVPVGGVGGGGDVKASPAAVAPAPSELSYPNWRQNVERQLRAEYPDAAPSDIADILKMQDRDWGKAVEEAAQQGKRLPDEVLDSYVDKYGDAIFTRTFRGVSEQKGYVLPKLRGDVPSTIKPPIHKELWQKTWDEIKAGNKSSVDRRLTPKDYQKLKADHKSAVQSALYNNKPVPAEVLADYPDLAPAPKAQGTGVDVPPTSAGGATLDAGKAGQNVSNTWQKVSSALSNTQAKHFDEIVKETNLPISHVSSELALAELRGDVVSEPGMMFRRVANNAPTVPPLSEGGATLDAGEPVLDPLAQINSARFKAVVEKMREAGAQSVLDTELTKQATDALEQALLDRIGAKFTQDAAQAANVMPADVQAEMNAYLKQQYMPALSNQLVKAQAMGRFFQNSTVLNYDQPWNIESALLLERPFIHWWLHSALNYTRDFIDHPAMLAYALHLSDNLQKESERLIAEGKLPERFRGTFKLTLPVELPGLGDTLWVNPMRLLFPYEDVLQLNALQKASYSDGEGDLGGVINDVFGVHLPIKLGWNALAQDWDEFQNTFATIPLNRMLKAGTGVGLEGKYDKFYTERAMKELVAEGMPLEEAKVAMLTRKGAAWQAIQQRANAENYSAKEGSALFGMRGKVYTPGEQKYNEAQRKRETLLTNAVRQAGGNPNMDENARYEFLTEKGFYKSPEWLQFKEQNPELDAGTFANQAYGEEGKRMPEDQAQTERARSYYLDKIKDAYWNAPELKQKLIAEDLGEPFKTLFRNKDTRDYAAVPLKTVMGWANALDQLLQDPVAGAQLPNPEPYHVTFTTDDQNKRYQAMYDEVGQSYGWDKYGAGWEQYRTLKEQNPAQAKAFLNSPEGKKLLAVSDTIDEFFKANPDIQNLLEKVGLRKPTSANTTPTQGQALTQAMTAAGLNWDTINVKKEEYNKLPKGTGARSKYLAQNPDLLRYFQLSGAIYNTDEELQQKNTKSSTSKPPTFYYNPKQTYYGKSYGAPNEKKPTRIYLNMSALGGQRQPPQQNNYVPRRVTPGGY